MLIQLQSQSVHKKRLELDYISCIGNNGRMQNLINTIEVAELLSITPRRVRQLVECGQLRPVVDKGRARLFDHAAVARFAKLDRPAGNPHRGKNGKFISRKSNTTNDNRRKS